MSETEQDQAEETEESALGAELYREYWGRKDGAEVEYHRRVFGQTYRERHGNHRQCIVLCLNPGRRKPAACPCCFGRAAMRPMDEVPGIEPVPGRGERLAAWLGMCLAAFHDALTLPFRLSQEHRIALVRDVLQDAMAAGLRAEVVQVCPVCEAGERAEAERDGRSEA